MSINCLTEFVV